MATRPQLFTRGLSSLSQSVDPSSPSVNSPAEQRAEAKQKLFQSIRPLDTQHVWQYWFDKPGKKDEKNENGDYEPTIQTLGEPIQNVKKFWESANAIPIDQIKMRESIYLFKQGYKPIWEDRRSFQGGSWTFRITKPKDNEEAKFWTTVQLLAIGEKLQEALEDGDQLCGVGLSVRFNSHLITIWHRDATKQKSIDGMLKVVLEDVPPELLPKADNYFYKKHSEHAGFNPPPELRAVLDSQKRAQEAAAAKVAAAAPAEGQ